MANNMATGEDLSGLLLGGHEEFFDFPCTLCVEQGKHVEAIRFCEDCFVFLCDVCLKSIHNRMPLKTGHKLLDQEKFPALSRSVIKSFPTKRCSKHPGELINIYCGNHAVICCSVCKALEHGTCSETQHLPDAAKGVQTSEEYQSTREETKDFLSNVSNLHAKRTAAISRIALEKQQVRETIAIFRKKMNTIFDNLEQKSLNELDTKEATIVDALESDRNFLDSVKKEADEMLQKLDGFKGDNECELFFQVKTSKHFIQESMKRVKDISSIATQSIIFNIDTSIENNLRSVVSLGSFEDVQSTTSTSSVSSTLELKQVSSDQAFIPSADTTDTNATTNHVSQYQSHVEIPDLSEDIVKYDLKMFGKFDVRQKSDTKLCDITDICQLTDGSILITDYNNKKLKRLDQVYKLVDSLKLPGKPDSVCVVGPSEAAVALLNEKKIQFVSLGCQLSMTRSFSTRSFCRGMVYTHNKLYVCCGSSRDSSSGSIEVFNNSGQLQYSLPRASQRLSAVPRYITVSDDGQHLCVTSFRTDNVYMLDLDGNLVNTYNSKELKTPSGMCTDGRGQLFVYGCNSDTIVQIALKHQRIVVILTDKDGVLKPAGVYYDKKRSRLLVCEKPNKLLAYTCSLIKS